MTVIGWGALLLVENQALFSFGVFAISGEIASLVAAVLALPAVLAGSQARQKRADHATRTRLRRLWDEVAVIWHGDHHVVAVRVGVQVELGPHFSFGRSISPTK